MSALRPDVQQSDKERSDTVLRACTVLRSFHLDGEVLRLRDLVTRTGLNKSTTLRLLQSLEKGGLVERMPNRQYRSKVKPIDRRQIRLGYAGEQTRSAFALEVTNGLLGAADQEGIDIVELDNRGSPTLAIRNAEKLIKAGVDLAIEYQRHEQVAPIISEKFRAAGIPLIAVSFPHPGAVYYGVNNYEAGLTAGHALGRWARNEFAGHVDEIILLGCPSAGSLLHSRLRGVEVGIREVLPGAQHARVVILDGGSEFSRSLLGVRRYLRFNLAGRILVGAINDGSALGGLCAFDEVGRKTHCGAVSFGASADGRTELRNPGTRLVCSVGYFPEKYGRELVALALNILDRKHVPPAVFINTCLITPENVDRFYAHDSLSGSMHAGRRH